MLPYAIDVIDHENSKRELHGSDAEESYPKEIYLRQSKV